VVAVAVRSVLLLVAAGREAVELVDRPPRLELTARQTQAAAEEVAVVARRRLGTTADLALLSCDSTR